MNALAADHTEKTDNVSSLSDAGNFDAIRLFAALIVIYGHSFPLTGAVGPGWLGNGVQTLAVKIFFIISGFLIVRSWLADPHPVRYFSKRALRIVPALVIVVIFSICVVGPFYTTLPLDDYVVATPTRRYLLNLIFYINYTLPGVFATNIYPSAVNGSFWTLPVEVAMYVISPTILCTASLRRDYAKYIIAAVCVAFIARFFWVTVVHVPKNPLIVYATNMRDLVELAPYFWLGAFYAVGGFCHRLSLQVAVVLLAFGAMINFGQYSELYLYVMLPYCVLALGLAKNAQFKFISRFGDFSYGTYLYGFLVQQMLSASFGASLNAYSMALAAAVISVSLGALSWHLIEKPMLALKPKRRRDVQPVAVAA